MNYMNKYWVFVDWTIESKFQWNSKKKPRKLSFMKMHLNISFSEIAAILSRGRWVKLCVVQVTYLLAFSIVGREEYLWTPIWR